MKFAATAILLAVGTQAAPMPGIMNSVSDGITKFMKVVAEKWPDNHVFATMSAAIGGLENVAGDVLGYSSMETDLDDGICGDVMLIWARGVSLFLQTFRDWCSVR